MFVVLSTMDLTREWSLLVRSHGLIIFMLFLHVDPYPCYAPATCKTLAIHLSSICVPGSALIFIVFLILCMQAGARVKKVCLTSCGRRLTLSPTLASCTPWWRPKSVEGDRRWHASLSLSFAIFYFIVCYHGGPMKSLLVDVTDFHLYKKVRTPQFHRQ